jgi:hypothetical protein
VKRKKTDGRGVLSVGVSGVSRDRGMGLPASSTERPSSSSPSPSPLSSSLCWPAKIAPDYDSFSSSFVVVVGAVVGGREGGSGGCGGGADSDELTTVARVATPTRRG